MRMLWRLRFRHVEHLLFRLTMALRLVAWWGTRGADSGFLAACLRVLHPGFGHAGVTSVLFVQLALSVVAVWEHLESHLLPPSTSIEWMRKPGRSFFALLERNFANFAPTASGSAWYTDLTFASVYA